MLILDVERRQLSNNNEYTTDPSTIQASNHTIKSQLTGS